MVGVTSLELDASTGSTMSFGNVVDDNEEHNSRDNCIVDRRKTELSVCSSRAFSSDSSAVWRTCRVDEETYRMNSITKRLKRNCFHGLGLGLDDHMCAYTARIQSAPPPPRACQLIQSIRSTKHTVIWQILPPLLGYDRRWPRSGGRQRRRSDDNGPRSPTKRITAGIEPRPERRRKG